MKKRNRHARLVPGPLILLLLLSVISAIIGIRVNSHIYDRELRTLEGYVFP